LREYLIPDILWAGGITELYKIRALSESFRVPDCPHDASGPITYLPGLILMMTVPNFYKLEINHASLNSSNPMLDEPLNINNGKIQLPTHPGLGINLDEKFIETHLDNDWK